MAGGWIKLHRKLTEWSWYKEDRTKSVFIHLLLSANHTDKQELDLLVKRGQCMTSLRILGDELGMTMRNVRTALEHLVKAETISMTSNNRFTLITVLNYDAYQDGPQDIQEEIPAGEGRTRNDTRNDKPNPQQEAAKSQKSAHETTHETTSSYIEQEDKNLDIYIPPIIPPQDPKKPDPIHEEIFDWLGAIPPLAVDDITDFRASPGIDDELIREAIKSTKARGIRQWSYAASILRDAIARGILTGQAFRNAKEVKTNGRRYEADEIHTRSPGRKQRSGAFIEKPGVDWDAIMPEA